MKKIIAILLSLSMIVLVACTNEKPLVRATGNYNGDEFEAEFFGTKDHVKKLHQTMIIDWSDKDDSQIDKDIEQAKEDFKIYKDLPVEHKLERNGTKVKEELIIEFTSAEETQSMIDKGLLQYPGEVTDKLSIEPFVQLMEGGNFNIEKNY